MRHKRQALQDMARPLKQWLYKHRDNPYPTKTEKILLALGSHMTLVQVRSEQTLTLKETDNLVRSGWGSFKGVLGWIWHINKNRYLQKNLILFC